MNWQAIITALINAGLSQKEIGKHADCSQNTVWMLLHGKTTNPAYLTGQKLIELHGQICNQKATA